MINSALESCNLVWLHSLLCLIGAVLGIIVMQMTSHLDDEVGEDPIWVIYVRRISMWLLVGSLMWCWSYALTKGWQPWPAYVALLMALDVSLTIRALTVRIRIKTVMARKYSGSPPLRFGRVAAAGPVSIQGGASVSVQGKIPA